MKAQGQSTPELTHICRLIEHIPTATLTIFDDSGAPLMQPLVPLELDGQGVLWFLGNLLPTKAEHPCIANLSFVDAVKPTYVELSGLAEIHVDPARIEKLWTSYARPWFPAGPDSATPALLKFLPKRAEYWDTSLSKLVRMATMAASAMVGKPGGLKGYPTLTGRSKHSPNAASP